MGKFDYWGEIINVVLLVMSKVQCSECKEKGNAMG